MDKFNRLASHPAILFLIAGAVLFILYAWLNPTHDPKTVHVSAGRIAALEKSFASVNQRVPTPEERQAFIHRYIEEEVLYREALALNLHLSDEIVRRRLVGTMEFLNESAAAYEDPSEEDLRTFWQSNRTDFIRPARLSLTHVYFNADNGAEEAKAAAEAALPQLIDGAEPRTLGDLFLRGRVLRGKNQSQLADIFGTTLAQELMAMDVGPWLGPVTSVFGFHLVRIDKRVEMNERSFEDVREDLLAAWRQQRIKTLRIERLNNLVESYNVVVDDEARLE